MAATEPLTHTECEVLKALTQGLVTAHPKTWSWRHKGGYVVSRTMRSLIADGYVRVDPDLTDGRRTARVTQAGYVELSRAGHAHTTTKAKKK